MIRLSELKPGEEGIIMEVQTNARMKRRLTDMGVTPGTQILFKRRAPLGDPLEFIIMEYRLSIRAADANEILIERSTPRNG